MRRVFRDLICVVALPVVAGCDAGLVSRQEIALPEGNADAGQAAFVELQCTTCHTVRGVDLPEPDVKGPVSFSLGGNVSRVKTYPELVTAVINPSHRIARNVMRQEIEQDGESIMTVYNDVMTVTQLVDIVAFLQSQYQEFERPRYNYPVYSYGGE
ncbi:MAG: c-type cytochrome [Woeseiaceae bacterium]|nr:c-type cytochrome [Woeseiaceae bacterium]